MRTIKFRGKRYGDNAWVCGCLYQGTKEGQTYSIILDDGGYSLAPSNERNFAIAFAEDEVNVVFPETVGQYTGLRDKNGREIYEGDIIVSQDYSHARHYVRYIDDEAMFVAMIIGSSLMEYCAIRQSWIDEYDKKIIGNIYDDPELL